jgi:hypothetical protein
MSKSLLSFAERIGGVTMPRMTEEEAWAFDEEVTKNPLHVDPSKVRHVS